MPQRRRSAGNEALDLVPIMNLVTILIPFMLMSAHFVSLAVVDVTAPASGSGDVEADVGLGLTVGITSAGFTVMGEDASLDGGFAVPCEQEGCPPGSYDTLGLTARLARVKVAHPDERVVVLVPDPTVPYHVLIDTMDAVRQDGRRELFPNVIVAGEASGATP